MCGGREGGRSIPLEKPLNAHIRKNETDRQVVLERERERDHKGEHASGHKERDSSEWYGSKREVKQSNDFTEKHKRNAHTHPRAACGD